MSVLDELTVFHFAWIGSSERTKYLHLYKQLTSTLTTMQQASLNVIIQQLKKKNLTDQGKRRKQRIIEKLFFKRKATLFCMNLYVTVLPMFKSFVLIFEQKEPMMHHLHDDMIELFRNFLACCIKHEAIAAQGLSPNKLKSLKVEKNMLKLSQIYVGREAEAVLLQMTPATMKSLLEKVQKAYLDTAQYMQKKLPMKNPVLKCLSALDPKAQGHSETFSCLKDLGNMFEHHMSTEQHNAYDKAARKMQIDKLPVFEEGARLDRWWNEVFKSYPDMKQVVKCCLSIFTGPRVEQSFSIMNNIICPKTNRLDVSTFGAIQTVKYVLQASHQTAIERYQRKDKLKSPVDTHLCNHMQTAYRRHKKKQVEKQSKKKTQELKGKKATEKVSSNVHKVADAIKKRIRQQQQLREVVKKNNSKQSKKMKKTENN